MYYDEAVGALHHQQTKDAFQAGAMYCLTLGAPLLADVDRYVVSVDMKNGAYTVAAQPQIPQNVTVTRTQVTATDTVGIITITGTNIDDEVITEVIIPGAHTVTVAGTKAFKTITSIVGSGWVINTDEDTITVGCGTEVGLPVALTAATECPFGVLDGTMRACATTVTDPPTVEGTTIDLSAGTYDGTKIAHAIAKCVP